MDFELDIESLPNSVPYFEDYQLHGYNKGTMSLESISLDGAQTQRFRVRGYDCDDYCSVITSCGQCVHGTDGECGWCSVDNKCKKRSTGSCTGGQLRYMDGGVQYVMPTPCLRHAYVMPMLCSRHLYAPKIHQPATRAGMGLEEATNRLGGKIRKACV